MFLLALVRLAAERVGSEGPDVALSITGAVATLRTVGVRVWFVEDVTATVEYFRVVRIGIVDSYVGPAVAGVAAVQGLRLIGLCHGHSAVPSDLGDTVAKPDDLQLEYLGQLGHGLLHAGVGQQRTDHRGSSSSGRLALLALRPVSWGVMVPVRAPDLILDT